MGGCIAGALEETEYRNKLAAAGFEDVDVEPTRVYRLRTRGSFCGPGFGRGRAGAAGGWKFLSAFIRAVKPSECEILLRSDLLQLRTAAMAQAL